MTLTEMAQAVGVVPRKEKHPKCKGSYDAYSGDFDCDYGSELDCGECKYGVGRKDPAAKCNQP